VGGHIYSWQRAYSSSLRKKSRRKNPKQLQSTGHAWATAVPMHKQITVQSFSNKLVIPFEDTTLYNALSLQSNPKVLEWYL
jgi:hypothetical protein